METRYKAISDSTQGGRNQKNPDQTNVGVAKDEADSYMFAVVDDKRDEESHDDDRSHQPNPPDYHF